MSTSDANKEILCRAFDEVWNRRDLAAIQSFYSADFVEHGFRPTVAGNGNGTRQWMRGVVADLPAARLTIEEMVAAGDKVAARYAVCKSGPAGIGARTSNCHEIAARGVIVVRLAASQLRETWGTARLADLLWKTHMDEAWARAPVPEP